MGIGAGFQAGVLAADRLGHAGPAVLGGPADAFTAEAPAEVGIGEEAVETAGERRIMRAP